MDSATADAIRSLRRRTELLAPAGRWDVLEAVVEAGADAVYLSGKRFQMRAHRKDFHFDDVALREASEWIHGRGRRLYVTVNTLLAAHETHEVRGFLEYLAEIAVDAAIVCDLGALAIAREIGVPFELHASTMMNVHDAEQALALRGLGIRRIVTSRDIGIQEAGRLGERAGVDIEYFLHGDMCVAHSGQCFLSGLALGKSGNRGECMKPCRWEYDLVSMGKDGPSEPLAHGHLMALRDLALIRHIPDLIDAGICGLKIEGRMRDAAYLRSLVGLYRGALDQYYDWPAGYALNAGAIETLFRQRVREFSVLGATGAPSNGTLFDISGRREPLMLSNGVHEPGMAESLAKLSALDAPVDPSLRHVPSLAVSVGSPEAAREAVEAGANRIYLAAETWQFGEQHWTAPRLQEAIRCASERGVHWGLRLPRVSGKRTAAEWGRIERIFGDSVPAFFLVHHLGDLRRALDRFPDVPIIADYGFNILNPDAAWLLAELGAHALVPALESGFEDVKALAEDSPLPLELVAHGPLAGMLLDHCVIAMHLTRSGAKEVCRGPCRQMPFALRDAKGALRTIVTDPYCRNHVLAEKDLAILPVIDAFLSLPAQSLRIEGQWYTPKYVSRVTGAYRRALDAWDRGETQAAPAPPEWAGLEQAGPRPWNLGGYAQPVTHSASTAEVMRALR